MNSLGLMLGTVLAISPGAAPQGPIGPTEAAPQQMQQPTAPQPTSAAPDKPRIKRKVAGGMLLGGAVATAAFVWGGGMIGASKLDSDSERDRDVGRVVAIPLVGPLAAAHRTTGTAKDRVPFVFLALEQMTSIAVMTVGAVGFHRHRMYERGIGKVRTVKQSTTMAMIATGLVGAGFAYGLTVGLSNGARRTGPPNYGRRFYIPLVGGIAAAPNAPSNLVAVASLTSSAFQLAGAGVAAAGIALSMQRRKRASRLAIVPMVAPGQAQLTATMRF